LPSTWENMRNEVYALFFSKILFFRM
jgi:hypothetical protein